jgi:putative transposase
VLSSRSRISPSASSSAPSADPHQGYASAWSTAPQSPWQNPYVERLVGSVRRECLDHVIVLGERHLLRILKSYFAYYHRSRTHLSLGKDAPEGRAVHLPHMGDIVELSEVGGLHHRNIRRVA